MKEEKLKDNVEELLKEALVKEANVILAEVEQHSELKNVTVPEELKEKLMKKIQKADEAQEAREKLAEPEQEALRGWREKEFQKGMEKLDIGEEPPIFFKRRKRTRRALLLVATVAIMVLAMGMTSIGGRPFIMDMFNAAVGEQEMTRVDSAREGNIGTEDIVTDDEAFYEEIIQTFGIEVVQMCYIPDETIFLMGDIDEEAKKVSMFYQCGEQVIEYRIIINCRTSSYGYDIEDEVVSEKILTVSDVPITVKKYQLPDKTCQYVAQFEYKNNVYVLNGAISEEEFEKILNNLFFF